MCCCVCCCTLQCVAVRCSVLHLSHVVAVLKKTSRSVLQCVAVCCSVLLRVFQCAALHCSVLHLAILSQNFSKKSPDTDVKTATSRSVLQCDVVQYSALPCVAPQQSCHSTRERTHSVWQCVAVCRRDLHCVAVCIAVRYSVLHLSHLVAVLKRKVAGNGHEHHIELTRLFYWEILDRDLAKLRMYK